MGKSEWEGGMMEREGESGVREEEVGGRAGSEGEGMLR